jgi:hypothetical protein
VGAVDPKQIRVNGTSIEGRWTEVQSHKRFDIYLVPRFLNCGSNVEEILRFTERYGPLITKPYGHPLKKDGRTQTQRPWNNTDWKFDLQEWRDAQAKLQFDWEIQGGLRTPGPWTLAHREQRRPIEDTKFQISSEDFMEFDQQRNEVSFIVSCLWRYLEVSLRALPANRLRMCTRTVEEECNSPYFVAEHLSQEYCSERCQHWAQKLAKREWWHRKQQEKQKELKQILKRSKIQGGKH